MMSGYKAERPLGYQQLTGISSATALTVPAGADLAIITTETQNVRWRDDGTNPTAAVGYPLPTNAELQYTGDGLSRLKFIEVTSGAVLNVCYYGN